MDNSTKQKKGEAIFLRHNHTHHLRNLESHHEKPYYLVKVVNRKWAEKLQNGEVFMRAISCFGDLSKRSEDANNQFRGDSLEGFSQSFENHHNPYAHTIDSTGNISEIVPNQVGMIDVLTPARCIAVVRILAT